jgi:ribose 5-phosphate isomerase A
MDAKKVAAEKAVEFIHGGMIVGLGTGSTAYWAIRKMGEAVSNGLRIQAVATSINSEKLAKEWMIPLISMSEVDAIDITIDGADEVDDDCNLIKGGGGALLREKIIASASKKLIIIVDESKKVNQLGEFPLPVEVVPFGHEITLRKLRALGCETKLRLQEGSTFVTDNGNYIVDCIFNRISRPQELHDAINMITGVVDNGLFIEMADKVIIGYSDGSIIEL